MREHRNLEAVDIAMKSLEKAVNDFTLKTQGLFDVLDEWEIQDACRLAIIRQVTGVVLATKELTVVQMAEPFAVAPVQGEQE